MALKRTGGGNPKVRLEAVLERLGGVLCRSWGHLGASCGVLDRLGAVYKRSWGVLERSRGVWQPGNRLGTSWGRLGAVLERSWGSLGMVLGILVSFKSEDVEKT